MIYLTSLQLKKKNTFFWLKYILLIIQAIHIYVPILYPGRHYESIGETCMKSSESAQLTAIAFRVCHSGLPNPSWEGEEFLSHRGFTWATEWMKGLVKISFRLDQIKFGTTDIWGQVIPCYGDCPMHDKIFSCILGCLLS